MKLQPTRFRPVLIAAGNAEEMIGVCCVTPPSPAYAGWEHFHDLSLGLTPQALCYTPTAHAEV